MLPEGKVSESCRQYSRRPDLLFAGRRWRGDEARRLTYVGQPSRLALEAPLLERVRRDATYVGQPSRLAVCGASMERR